MTYLVRRAARILRRADAFYHVDDFLWWRWRHHRDSCGDGKVQQHAKESDSFGRDAEPVIFVIRDELEIDNVSQRQSNSSDHSRDGAFAIDSL